MEQFAFTNQKDNMLIYGIVVSQYKLFKYSRKAVKIEKLLHIYA